MLRKLLKYDLKAQFRFWWIAAVVCLAMSLAGGFSWMLLEMDRPLPDALETLAGMLCFLTVLSYIVFFILTTVVLFLRFQRNFFTDEGYLTFTLPVHRHSLLNSKIISGMILNIACVFIIFAGFCVMYAIGMHEYVFSGEFWKEFTEGFRDMLDSVGGYFWVYLGEFLLMLLLSSLMSLLFLYTLITFGCVVAKKAKVIASIGIYYLANWVLSFLLGLLMGISIDTLGYWMVDLTDDQVKPMVALLWLCVLLFEAMVCAVLYAMQYRMLKRKLNLS